jgi:general secretion pathway protein D
MKIFSIKALAQFTASAFLASLVIGSLPAQATLISVVPSASTITQGQSFSVDIRVSGVSDLYGFEFDLGFNPSILSATSIIEGAFLALGGPTLWFPGTIDNSGGTISYTADSLQSIVPGVNGDGILASVNFTALATGSSELTISGVTLLDSALADISFDNPQNTHIVINSNSGPTPSVPEPATFGLLAIGLIVLTFSYHKRLNSA